MAAELDRIISGYIGTAEDAFKDKLQAAGLIVVDKDGNTLYDKAFGQQHLAPNSAPFTNDSVCWVASLTKLVTAVAVVQCLERDLIGLDDDVGDVVPELKDLDVLKGFDDEGKPILEKKTKAITLRTLLTHTSGFTYDSWDPVLLQWSAATGRGKPSYDEARDYIFPLKFEPGCGWEYGVGTDWAGHVVQVLTRSPTLDAYFQEHIFQPLGMQDSTLLLGGRPDLQERVAQIAHRDPEAKTLAPGTEDANRDRPVMGGGGALRSTAGDFGILVRGLLTEAGQAKLFRDPARSVEVLFRPAIGEEGGGKFQSIHDHVAPVGLKGRKVSWALGGVVVLDDVEGRRKGGSVRWSGVTGPQWWIDRTGGVGAVLMVQVLPPADKVVQGLLDEVERGIYGGLVGKA